MTVACCTKLRRSSSRSVRTAGAGRPSSAASAPVLPSAPRGTSFMSLPGTPSDRKADPAALQARQHLLGKIAQLADVIHERQRHPGETGLVEGGDPVRDVVGGADQGAAPMPGCEAGPE